MEQIHFFGQFCAHLCATHEDLSLIQVILPSKRLSRKLLQEIYTQKQKAFVSPEIFTLNDWVAKETKLTTQIDAWQMMDLLYHSYQAVCPNVFENLDSFWHTGELILHDFNEIDLYIADKAKFFKDLQNLQDLENWASVEAWRMESPAKTHFVNFWKDLEKVYQHFGQALAAKNWANSGRATQRALEKWQSPQVTNAEAYYFLGFNAFSPVEQALILALSAQKTVHVFWEIDEYYQNEPFEAGLFFRKWQANPRLAKLTKSLVLQEMRREPRQIHIVQTTSEVAQAQCVREWVEDIHQTNPNLADTALLLADESLLLPILNTLPDVPCNVSVGFSALHSPLYAALKVLFDILENLDAQDQDFPYLSHEELEAFLAQSYWRVCFQPTAMQWKELPYLPLHLLLDDAHCLCAQAFRTLFYKKSPVEVLEALLLISEQWQAKNLPFATEAQDFLRMILQSASAVSFVGLKVFAHLVLAHLKENRTDFSGDKGLQVMGILESRGLNFEHIILTSFSEGVFPPKRKENSYIPQEVRRVYGLPTHKERDALYAYYFYRLLGRAKNLYICHNTQSQDSLSSAELSRFAQQLVQEWKNINPAVSVHQSQYSLALPLLKKSKNTAIAKTPAVLAQFEQTLARGLSASAFIAFLHCPLDFYYRYVLQYKPKEPLDVELASNTLGTAMHQVLEDIYSPLLKIKDTAFIAKHLEKHSAKDYLQKAILANLSKFHKVSEESLNRGYNYLLQAVSVHLVEQVLQYDLARLKAEQPFVILGLEQKMEYRLYDYTFNGKVDRVELCGDTLRIIDYKTGKLDASKIKIGKSMAELFDKAESYPIQLLYYAWIYGKSSQFQHIDSALLSLQRIQQGAISLDLSTYPDWQAEFEALVLAKLNDFKNSPEPIMHNEKAHYCAFCRT